MTSAVSVRMSTVSVQGTGVGLSPSAALQSIIIRPIPYIATRKLIEAHHYLHSMPGGTRLVFGAFLENRLLGAMTFGCGPAHVHELVKGAEPDDCLTLTRFWLSNELPPNSESRIIGITLRALKKFTQIKFLVTYADPNQGHVGTIYQATGWTYTGLSEAMPKFDLGDGRLRHSRSLSHSFGSHSLKHFEACGVKVRVVSQSHKHRYIYFIDQSLKSRLKVSTLHYPKRATV